MVRDEVHRALRAAQEARNATEKAERECWRVEDRNSKILAHFAKVGVEVEKGRERIEMGSTRFSRLAADAQHLTERKIAPGIRGRRCTDPRRKDEHPRRSGVHPSGRNCSPQ